MERIARSVRLVRQSYRVLRQDAELLLLPFLSGSVMAVVLMAIVAVAGRERFSTDRNMTVGEGAGVVAVYVLLYAIGIFFQCALIAGATERLRGGNPTVASALQAAWSRIGTIVLWAVLAATVGIVLRVVLERFAGVLGRVAAILGGLAWSAATFFVLPIITLEHVPLRAVVGRSSGVLRRAWGEAVAGGTGLGLVAFCAWGTLVMLTLGLASLIGISALVFAAVGAILLGVVFSTLEGVYVAALYRYATLGDVPPGFDSQILTGAFAPRRGGSAA